MTDTPPVPFSCRCGRVHIEDVYAEHYLVMKSGPARTVERVCVCGEPWPCPKIQKKED